MDFIFSPATQRNKKHTNEPDDLLWVAQWSQTKRDETKPNKHYKKYITMHKWA